MNSARRQLRFILGASTACSIGASCFVRADARLDEPRLRAGLAVLDPTPPVERPAT